MEENKNVLRLNLKKDLFEKVKNGDLNVLTFETTPFYFSRFTSSKYNKIENVLEDKSLFRDFDSVIFQCSGEHVEYDCVSVGFTDDETPEFILNFSNNEIDDMIIDNMTIYSENYQEISEDVIEIKQNVEYVEHEESQDEEIEHVQEPIEETNVETGPETEHVDTKEEDTEVEDTTMLTMCPNIISGADSERIFDKIINKSNVFHVKSSMIRVGYHGYISGCDKKLPCRNEHEYMVKLNKMIISYTDVNDFENKLDELTNKNYVFICFRDSYFNENCEYEIMIGIVDKLTVLNWM